MKTQHQENLEELKADVDEEYGIEAKWISSDGVETPVTGIFSLQNKRSSMNSKSKSTGQLEVDHVVAYFSMAPLKAKAIKERDKLLVNDVRYLVLPFQPGTYETILPLKITADKNHNWSGYSGNKT